MGLHTGLISGLIVTGTDMPSLLLPGLLIKRDLGSRAWIRIGGRLVRDSDPHSQLEQTSNHRDMDLSTLLSTSWLRLPIPWHLSGMLY